MIGGFFLHGWIQWPADRQVRALVCYSREIPVQSAIDERSCVRKESIE